jgi:CubicO group peptidase (beta-lactamase class C family)
MKILLRAGHGLLVFLTLFLAIGCVSAPRYPPQPRYTPPRDYEEVASYLERWIPPFMAEKNVPGLAIALVDESGAVWTRGFGFADRERHVPFTERTHTAVASLSKLFTCAAIMRLAEQGKIDLDAPLGSYVPEFAIRTPGWSPAGITIRRMLTHHSGLPSDKLKGCLFGDTRPPDYPDTFFRLPALLADDYVANPPDTVFCYSDVAYSLLGIVVARAGGGSFATYMQETILGPLGMRDSSFQMDDAQRASSARYYADGRAHLVPYIREVPAGGLVSTAEDMARFVSAMIASAGGRSDFLSPATVREMWSKQNEGIPLDFEFDVGLTWWRLHPTEFPGVTLVSHNGDLAGYHSFVLIDPGRSLGVFITTNGVDAPGSANLAPLAVEALRAMILSRGDSSPAPPSKPTVAPLPAEAERDFPGFYSTPRGLVQVKVARGRLKVNVARTWLDGVYHADGSVSLEARLLSLKIHVPALDDFSLTFQDLGGTEYLCQRVHGTLVAPAEKVSPVPAPDTWLRRAGRYCIEDPDPLQWLTDVSLGLDRPSGFFELTAKIEGSWATFPLQPLSDTEALLVGIGRNLGETVRIVSTPTGEKLVFQGYTFSRI